MDIENPFRWSKSRASTFVECKRKYYLRYYAHWGGWEKDASERARLAYRLGKMQTMPTLVGTAVHEVFARHFQALRNGQFRELRPEQAVEKMRTVWSAASRELWRTNPKTYPPLFELYYRRVPPDERLREYAEQARQAVRALGSMTLYRSLLSLGRPEFLWIDPAVEKFTEQTYFSVPPFEAIAAPDLVFRQGRRVVIIDWKTGKPAVSDNWQMGAGALWARQRLEVGENEIRACLVYLKNGTVDEFSVDEEIAARAAAAIRREMEAMAEYLKNRGGNIPLDEERFPRHDNPGFCRHCEFQELCS